MLSKFSNIKTIKVIDVKSRPVDGDGDGKYTSNPALGDVTPMPLGLALDADVLARETPELDFISDQYRDSVMREFPNARFRRRDASEPEDRWSQAGLGFWKVDAGTGDIMDDLFVGQSLTRNWASDALTPSSSETGRAMDLWRSGFGESASIRAIAEGRTDLPERFDTEQFRTEARQLIDAVQDGAEFGAPSYRVAYAPEGLEIGSTMDLPIASVAFRISDAAAFELSDVMDMNQPRKDYFMFPNDARGLVFDDSDTFMKQAFRAWPVEGIVSGKFRVVGKKPVEFLGPLGKQETRDVWVLDIVDDRVPGPVAEPQVVVKHVPDMVGQRVLGNDITQPSGAPVRGIVMDPKEVPDTLFHVSPKAQQILDEGVLRAKGSGGLGGDNRDQIVSMTTDREIAENLADSMRLVARLVDEFGADSDDKDRAKGIDRRLKEQAASEGWEFFQSEDFLRTTLGEQLNPYFWQRQSATGKRNPMFVDLAPERWQGISEDDIGIIEVPKQSVVDSGALVTNFDLGQGGLEEIRAYGDLRVSGDTPLDGALEERADAVIEKADGIVGDRPSLTPDQVEAIEWLSSERVRNYFRSNKSDYSGEPLSREQRGVIEGGIARNLEDAFAGSIKSRDGREYKVEVFDASARPNEMFIKMKIYDPDGEEVGSGSRTINLLTGEVYHLSLNFDFQSQGLGLGTAFNARNESIYKMLGARQIVTSGMSTVNMRGTTHWPRNGFDWDTADERTEFLGYVEQGITKYLDGGFAESVQVGLDGQRFNPYYFNPTQREILDNPFGSREQAEALLESVRKARFEDFDSDSRMTSGEFVRWPGADLWFQSLGTDIIYSRKIGSDQPVAPKPDVVEPVALPAELESRVDQVADRAEKALPATVDGELQSKLEIVRASASMGRLRELGDAWSDSRGTDATQESIDRYYEIVAEVEAALTDAFSGTITDRSGTEYEVNATVTAAPNRANMISLYLNIVHPDGTPVGEATRYIWIKDDPLGTPYGPYVDHSHLAIEPALRADGLGTAFNARNEALYREMGIYRISTTGVSDKSGYIGASHWPRRGFDWSTSQQRERFLNLVDEAASSYLDGTYEREFRDAGFENDEEFPFASREHAEQIREMVRVALDQPFTNPMIPSEDPDETRLTAGDFVHWPGVTEWFQLRDADVKYQRFLEPPGGE